MELKVGDNVKFTPTVTFCPWVGTLTGKVLFVDTDCSALIEVKNGGGKGHNGHLAGNLTSTSNAWWFLIEDLKKE